MGTAALSSRVVAAWGRPWQELAHPRARGDARGPPAPQSFRSAALSSRRELMPSLVNTLRRCHSTVRTDRNSWAVISALVWPSASSRTLTAPLAAAPPCHDQEPRARGCAGRGQPDRGRLYQHAVLGLTAWRPERRAPGAAPYHAADRPRRRPADIAALAVHLMTNTATTGATIDIG